MKCFFRIIALFFALSPTATFAATATPVAEPQLPADIALWFKMPTYTCSQYPGKLIARSLYIWSNSKFSKKVELWTLNGQHIYYGENTVVRTRHDKTHLRYYVRNVLENTWLAYEWREENQLEVDVLTQLGLTKEQFVSCDWKTGKQK